LILDSASGNTGGAAASLRMNLAMGGAVLPSALLTEVTHF
jgi:hypothetical protein